MGLAKMAVGFMRFLLDMIGWLPCVFTLAWVLKNYDTSTLGPAVAIMGCTWIYGRWDRFISECYDEHKKERDG